ncbi:MAG: hypothetical protein ACOX2K_01525 [Bacillota bacterium]|jgi:NADP-reducing hydrogenase subunit HndB
MLSIEQLNEIRERVSKELKVRHPAGRLVVSVGTMGLAAGAREVMTAAVDEISALGLPLAVGAEDCDASPGEMPLVRVLLPQQAEKRYAKVTADRVRQIVRDLAGVAANN